MTGRKRWADLSTGERVAVVVVGTAEVALTVAAITDLIRRPAGTVRGPKALWAVGCVVQPVGPVAYLILGRRPVAPTASS